MTRIAVISAGLSVPSSTRLLADRLAAASVAALHEPVEVDVIELRPLAHPLADHLLTGFPTGELADAIETVRRADALIVVTPVFSASYSGLFKTFFDVLEPDTLAGVPVLIAATAGTAAALAGPGLRAPAAVHLPARRRRPDRRLRRQRRTSATPGSTPGSTGPPASSPRC